MEEFGESKLSNHIEEFGNVIRIGLKFIPHPKSYNVSWVNNTSIAIKDRCFFPRWKLVWSVSHWCRTCHFKQDLVI